MGAGKTQKFLRFSVKNHLALAIGTGKAKAFGCFCVELCQSSFPLDQAAPCVGWAILACQDNIDKSEASEGDRKLLEEEIKSQDQELSRIGKVPIPA